ncbi:MAG TPA: sugar transferase [Candidatus Saccharimonadales bacterium]|nr:sugar transferase [Candidatus Saccharimonadales bacterium]
MKSNASLVYNLCLVVGDFLALVAAFVGAFFIRSQSAAPVPHPISIHTYFYVFLGVLPFWLLIFALLGLYNSNIYERRFSEFGRLLLGSFIGMLFVVFWNFVSVTPIFPAKLVPVYGFLLSFLFLVMFRNIARLVRTELFGFNIGLTHVALVGTNIMTRELVESLANSRHSGYKVVAIVGDKRQAGNHPIATYPTFRHFLEGNTQDVHGIIQTELYADEKRNEEILNYAQENHVGYRFVPGNTELFVGNIDVELFRNAVPVIAVHQTALFGWGRVAKRLFDLVAGIAGLAIVSPLLLLIAIAQKIADPKAPVFYKPQRLSRFGNSFAFYKFRSMYWEYCTTPEEGFAKMGRPDLLKAFRENGDQLPNDPRITPIGRLLRKTSLDELPQLINVVKGDLSLVGPRALDIVDIEKYDKKNLILSVKTGLTGLAQVSGRRDISFEERRKLDLYYVQNWTFWLDIVILVKTIRVVLGGRGTNA